MGGIPDPELVPGQTRLDFWMNPNLDRIGEQLPYDILPIYIQPDPEPADSEPPIPFQPEIVLTEGAHIGYTFQWFSFDTVLFVGYPFYLRRQMSGQG